MKNQYLSRFIALLMALIITVGNVYAYAADYQITVENGRLEKQSHSIEKEYRDLIKAIVATASDKMTTIYPKTFGHLQGCGLTLGLIENDSINGNDRAAVDIQVQSNRYPKMEINLALALEVNMINFRWPGNPMTEENKKRLISTISHETMHAMMIESLTAGLTSNSVNAELNGGRFPNWFIEGTAVVSGGGTEFVDNLLYYAPRNEVNNVTVFGKHITDPTLSEIDVEKALTKASLVEGREPNSHSSINMYASYGTGYLACMYLGDLIADADGDLTNQEPNVVKIRAGLDTLMSHIAEGYSLDLAINKLTKYSGLKDFEENSLHELAAYTIKLIQQIKGGAGSVLTHLDSTCTLDPANIMITTAPAIVISDQYTRMVNKYPAGHIVIKGGGRFNTGYDFTGEYPADAPAPDILIDSASVNNVAIDFVNEKITGLLDDDYLINDKLVSPTVDGCLDITPYIGKAISVVKKGHNYLKNSAALNLNIPARKKIKIEVENITDDSIRLKAAENAEYKLDEGEWQASPVFENLVAEKEYTVYQRLKAVENESFKVEQVEKKIRTAQKNTLEKVEKTKKIITVKVIDKKDNSSITGATITVKEKGNIDAEKAEDDNVYKLELGKTYTITAEQKGYQTRSTDCVVNQDSEQIVALVLEKTVANSKTASESKAKPAPQPEPKTKPEPKVESKPVVKPNYKAASKPVPKPELKPVLKSETESALKLETKKPYRESFKDINKKDWYYAAVKFAYEHDFMKGESKTKFNPNGDVTRAQIVTILHRLSGDKTNDLKCVFSDVQAEQWYSAAVNWASKNGIVNGVDQNKFAPNRNVSREELVTILYRFSEKDKRQAVSKIDHLAVFADREQISDYAVEAMTWAIKEGLISGLSDSTIAPQSGANRAQIATILMRYIQKYGK